MKKKKNAKNSLKYKKYSNWDVIVKSQNVLKCTVNVLIFKFFAIKTVIVLVAVISNQMKSIEKLSWML